MSGKSVSKGSSQNRFNRAAPYPQRGSYAEALCRPKGVSRGPCDPLTEDLRNLHDLHPLKLRELSVSLDTYNSTGIMVTFDDSVNDWVPWYRPERLYRNGRMVPVGAKALKSNPNVQGPMCPHSANEFRVNSSCEMTLVNLKCLDGITRFHYTANSTDEGGHLCSYQVYVPSIGGAAGIKVIHSEGERLGLEQQEIEADMFCDDDSDCCPKTTRWTTNSTPGPSGSSPVGSPGSTKFNSSPVHPSSSLANLGKHRELTSSPSPAPLGSAVFPLSFTVTGCPSFRTRADHARDGSNNSFYKLANLVVNDDIDHPAGESLTAPPALAPYHLILRSSTFAHTEFKNTEVARGFRFWNSVEGVTDFEWLTLTTAGVVCCSRTFSYDGFVAHRKLGCFTAFREPKPNGVVGHPSRTTESPELSRFKSEIYDEMSPADMSDHMIARALIEWNSVVGIPLEAWHTAITASIRCPSCHLHRSFEGHWDPYHIDLLEGRDSGCKVVK